MINQLHPDAREALVGRRLLAYDPEMAKKVGRIVRFVFPNGWKPSDGTAKRDFLYKVIGVQKIWDGRLAFRVLCLGFEDDFGCPALPNEIKFVSEEI